MIKLEEKLKNYLEEIEKNNKKGKKINAILQIRNENELFEEAKKIQKKIDSEKAGKLAGKIIVVKANINVRGMNCSCASKVLENYIAAYDATVIKKIKEEDGLIIGIANMDEFACGGSGETSAFGATQNPKKIGYIPGGSSSGSVAAVSAGFCDMALGSDTGGSIRNPSSHCGVVGIKPTYASVSRFGLIDLSMSLDQIGTIANNVEDAALLLSVISGKDEKDSTSQNSPKMNIKNLKSMPKQIKIGVLDLDIRDKRIRELVDKRVEEFSKRYNASIKKIKLNYIDLAIETYYPLVYVEFFSGTRRFDGRRYGEKIEESAGPEVLRRILGGSEITKAEHAGRYYNLSLKAKKLIEKEFSKAFKDVDCVISPVVPRLPHRIGEKISVEEMYAYDALTIPANLAGNCAISVPAGLIENTPIGIQIMCDKFQDEKMLQVASAFEKL
jgi:aspartyl-tRNA(Asn)/glutamyl-tRNA(Gln) amidotransferase subunit A